MSEMGGSEGTTLLQAFTSSLTAASGPEGAAARLSLAQEYSYVVPTDDLLRVLGRYQPIVELGAGTGYWARLLRDRGIDIVAYDIRPLHCGRTNRYHPGKREWTTIIEGDVASISRHSDRTLFVCWPPVYSELWDAARFYSGSTVAYIGDYGGRTARIASLEVHFHRVESHPVSAVDPGTGCPPELSIWVR